MVLPLLAAGSSLLLPCALECDDCRNISRRCYQQLWTQRCVNSAWTLHWEQREDYIRSLTYEELRKDLLTDPWLYGRCVQYRSLPSLCKALVDWIGTLSQSALLYRVTHDGRYAYFSEEQLQDFFDVSRTHCQIPVHSILRVLLHDAPVLFSPWSLESLKLVRILGAEREGERHAAIHYDRLLVYLLRTPLLDLLSSLVGRALLAALRLLCELKFARYLAPEHGLYGVAGCALDGFHGTCRPQGGTNVSSLSAFYRHRFPGLPPSLVARWRERGEGLAVASGLLAVADRRRNLGEVTAPSLALAQNAFRRALASTRLEDSLDMAGARNSQHVVWHLLDKLASASEVLVPVSPPVHATAVPAWRKEVRMAVVPDHDPVSDHIRQRQSFHCPEEFYENLEEVASPQIAAGTHVVVVEVGGYTGDCLLWAGGWLGPGRLRALEVEPVAIATARLHQSLVRNGLHRAVTVATTAVGDGAAHTIDGTGRRMLGSPNLVQRRCDDSSVVACQRMRTLDEVLANWSALAEGVLVDLVRVKTNGQEAFVLGGLSGHLRASRIRRLQLETPDLEPNVQSVRSAVALYPQYELVRETVSWYNKVLVYQLS